MQSVKADKFIAAIKRNKRTPIKGRWITQEGACPLYIYCWGDLKKRDESIKISDRERILKYMLNKFGLDYRNGFTLAVDGYNLEDLEENSPDFLKGFEDGEYVLTQLGGIQ